MNTHHTIMITTGGTGGHLYPAISFANSLRENNSKINIIFVGGHLRDSLKNDFDFQQFKYITISCAPFKYKPVSQLIKNGYTNLKGILQGLRILSKHKPCVVIGFGCYHAFPLLSACILKKTPYYLHEGNSVPGKLNKLFAKSSQLTACTFPDARIQLHGKTCLSEFFIRKELEAFNDKAAAYHYYGLNPSKKTLLFFGGSQGAKSINQLAKNILDHLNPAIYQILVITGTSDITFKNFDAPNNICIRSYEKKMHYAYAIADLAFLRAGSSTICEIVKTQTPSVLIPYPYATDNHQLKNAKYITENMGGYLIEEKDLSTKKAISLVNLHFIKSKDSIIKSALKTLYRNHQDNALTKAVLSHITY